MPLESLWLFIILYGFSEPQMLLLRHVQRWMLKIVGLLINIIVYNGKEVVVAERERNARDSRDLIETRPQSESVLDPRKYWLSSRSILSGRWNALNHAD